MSGPAGAPASEPWWRRRRGAIDTAVALLVVPAVIGIGLAAGGAFDSDDDGGEAVPVASSGPEMQGPFLPGTSLTPAAPVSTPAPTTAVPTTAVPTTPVPTTAAPTTAAPTTAAPSTPAPTPTAPAATPSTVRTTAPAPTTSAAPAVTAPLATAPATPATARPTTTRPAPVTSTPAPRPSATAAPAAPRPPPAAPQAPGRVDLGKAPAAQAGTDFAYARGAANADLRTWQAQMAERGWDITADGIFGAETLRVLKAFQAEKGLSVDGLLGPQSWVAAWNAPVT